MSEILKSEMMKGELRRVAKLLEEWASETNKDGWIEFQEKAMNRESNKIYAFLGRIEAE